MPYLGNEVAPLVQALEGKELKLDSDGDSSITADTDDRVDVKVGGSDIAHVTSTGLGVNTNSPSTALHIKDSDGGILQTVETGDSGNAYLKFINSTTGSGAFSDGFLVGLDTDESATFWLYEGNHMKFATSGTEALRIDANGHITKPLQPAFSARVNTAMQDRAVNTNHTVAFDQERFDQNSDYNNSTYTFTAPATGKYQFNCRLYLQNVPSNATYIYFMLYTSNVEYLMQINDVDNAQAYDFLQGSILADMDANDTAYVYFYQPNGSATTHIHNGNTYFTGHLVA